MTRSDKSSRPPSKHVTRIIPAVSSAMLVTTTGPLRLYNVMDCAWLAPRPFTDSWRGVSSSTELRVAASSVPLEEKN